MPLFLVLILPIGVYFGVYMISKPQLKIGNISIAKAKSEDLKQLMEEGYNNLRKLEQGSTQIKDEEIQGLSKNLYFRGVDIYEHLQSNPDKIPVARKFLNYYLETAAGLVTKYEKLSDSKAKGDSIKRAEKEVKEGLLVLEKAFDKEFEHMMQGDIMDIELDVKVLEQTFKSEED